MVGVVGLAGFAAWVCVWVVGLLGWESCTGDGVTLRICGCCLLVKRLLWVE